jgi:hypothetical protein
VTVRRSRATSQSLFAVDECEHARTTHGARGDDDDDDIDDGDDGATREA